VFDSSHEMIAFASSRFGPAARSNVRFQVADARSLPFREEFDLIVSLYVLHWLPEQDAALRSMPCAFRPNGLAQLRLVPDGKRKSLELVIEDTRHSAKWARYFQEFRDPYLHLTAKQYGALVARETEHSRTRAYHPHSEREQSDRACRQQLAVELKADTIRSLERVGASEAHELAERGNEEARRLGGLTH
jgi:ubiquinone/menaquinone biosynthesis C-methylase UbiE